MPQLPLWYNETNNITTSKSLGKNIMTYDITKHLQWSLNINHAPQTTSWDRSHVAYFARAQRASATRSHNCKWNTSHAPQCLFHSYCEKQELAHVTNPDIEHMLNNFLTSAINRTAMIYCKYLLGDKYSKCFLLTIYYLKATLNTTYFALLYYQVIQFMHFKFE